MNTLIENDSIYKLKSKVKSRIKKKKKKVNEWINFIKFGKVWS